MTPVRAAGAGDGVQEWSALALVVAAPVIVLSDWKQRRNRARCRFRRY